MTLKDHSFVNKFKVLFVCIPEDVWPSNFGKCLKCFRGNLSTKEFFFPKNFELCAKFRGVQSKPGGRYLPRYSSSRETRLADLALNPWTSDVKKDRKKIFIELATWVGTCVPLDQYWRPLSGRLDRHPSNERFSQDMQLTILPLFRRGLKLLDSKPRCRISALHFFENQIPPIVFWQSALSDNFLKFFFF
jgi:hypothetical protein